MNVRSLSNIESANLATLNRAGIQSVLLFVTETGLKKSILDSTEPMRALFKDSSIHDFSQQGKGPSHKVYQQSVILRDDGLTTTKLSLYRPKTKEGDPRMWFYGLSNQAQAGDVYAVFVLSGIVHAINLGNVHLSSNHGTTTFLDNFIQPLIVGANSVSGELLNALREIASKGPIQAIGHGNTTVGMSIEAALGLPANSSREPDYKGIELKSGRSPISGRETRVTLFACVPDWNLSTLKSSSEILQKYGYSRGNDFKLYCTISTLRPNSQGLQFIIDDAQRKLREIARLQNVVDVAIWPLSKLENYLVDKHRETFWIKARPESRGGHEYFHLESVTHTRNPNLPQLSRLLSDGTITMDHLIKRTATGGAAEKGPLFKIERKRIAELFYGAPTIHYL